MAGDFDFLHIKRRTAGSSNELSFDVLDAARDSLDSGKSTSVRSLEKTRGVHGVSRREKNRDSGRREGEKRGASNRGLHVSPIHSSRGAPAGYRISAFGTSGNSSYYASTEVERRKRARRVSRIRAWLITIVIVAALVGAGVFFGSRFYKQRSDYNVNLGMLMSQLIEVDQTLVSVDVLMKKPATASQSDDLERALASIPVCSEKMRGTASEAEKLKSGAKSDAEMEALDEVASAAEVRVSLLESGEAALRLRSEVSEQMANADAALSALIEGDQLARDAADLANAASDENQIVEARDKTYQASEAISDALRQIEALENVRKELQLTDWKAYAQKRLKALSYAVNTSSALLANDRSTAKSANDSYNAIEKDAADVAARLPESLSKPVRDSYAAELEKTESDYKAARARISEVDAKLRGKL